MAAPPADFKFRERECEPFSLRFTPRLKLGHSYTIKVRATNGAGPAEWSEASKALLFSYCPSKPQRPKCSYKSSNRINIVPKKLSEDENGSPVTNYIVVYRELHVDPEYIKVELDFWEIDIVFLKVNSHYKFILKMENRAGVSPPSDVIEIVTLADSLRDIKVECSSIDCLIVTWKNPRTARCAYNVQKWEATGSPSHACEVKDRSYKSFEGLNYKNWYCFRVQSFNDEGEAGDWSDWTRWFWTKTELFPSRSAHSASGHFHSYSEAWSSESDDKPPMQPCFLSGTNQRDANYCNL